MVIGRTLVQNYRTLGGDFYRPCQVTRLLCVIISTFTWKYRMFCVIGHVFYRNRPRISHFPWLLDVYCSIMGLA